MTQVWAYSASDGDRGTDAMERGEEGDMKGASGSFRRGGHGHGHGRGPSFVSNAARSTGSGGPAHRAWNATDEGSSVSVSLLSGS